MLVGLVTAGGSIKQAQLNGLYHQLTSKAQHVWTWMESNELCIHNPLCFNNKPVRKTHDDRDDKWSGGVGEGGNWHREWRTKTCTSAPHQLTKQRKNKRTAHRDWLLFIYFLLSALFLLFNHTKHAEEGKTSMWRQYNYIEKVMQKVCSPFIFLFAINLAGIKNIKNKSGELPGVGSSCWLSSGASASVRRGRCQSYAWAGGKARLCTNEKAGKSVSSRRGTSIPQKDKGDHKWIILGKY